MKFNLKKYNTSGLSYVNDGQILATKIKYNQIISSRATCRLPEK